MALVIGRKKDGDTYYLFNHNRGSNIFFEKGIKTLIIKGTPWVHVGAMLDEFRTLHGDCQDPNDENAFHKKFNEFYFHKVGAEIQQACGRLRHQWRPGEQLKIYLLTSKLDLSFLHKRYGVKIKHMEGFELTPFAGTKAQCLIFRALGVAKTLFDKSGKTKLPNQQAIADLLGITQGRVSQIAEEYLARGWADFRRILLGSLSDPYREINNNERSSDQELPKGDLDPDQVYFQEEIYKSRGDRQARSENWVPEVFDASIPFIGLAGLLEDSQEEDLRLLGKELHPYEQAEMIAHVFAHSSSGMESRSSKYGISYSEIQPFVDLIWGKESWFTKPDWLIEAEETAIA
jgi:transcriptional regulator with XRE-family HTH domain